jgi:hypothetical protein
MTIANTRADPAAIVEKFIHLAYTILTPAPFSPPAD